MIKVTQVIENYEGDKKYTELIANKIYRYK